MDRKHFIHFWGKNATGLVWSENFCFNFIGLSVDRALGGGGGVGLSLVT